MFQRLAVRAQDHGYAGLDVLMRPEHQRLLDVFQRCGLPATRRDEDGLVQVRLSLLHAETKADAERGPEDAMRWQRTSVRYITRYRSTNARYTIESVASSSARWHLRRQRANGSDLLGVFASARDASAAAEVDAATSRPRHPDEVGSGRIKRRR
jgi:hypothetical protein